MAIGNGYTLQNTSESPRDGSHGGWWMLNLQSDVQMGLDGGGANLLVQAKIVERQKPPEGREAALLPLGEKQMPGDTTKGEMG